MVHYIGLVFLLLAWLQPLHVLPWMSWHSEVLAFLGVALLTANTAWRAKQSASTRIPWVALIFLALTAVVAAQLASGLIAFPGDAIVLALYMALCTSAAWVGFNATGNGTPQANNTRRDTLLVNLAVCTLAGAVFSCFIAFMQSFNVWSELDLGLNLGRLRRPGANLGQPNQLATLLLMGLASLAFLYEIRKLGKWCAFTLLAPLLVGLALTESRTAIVSLLAILIWWIWGRRVFIFRTRPFAVATALCFFLIAVVAMPPLVTAVDQGGWDEGASRQKISMSAGTRLIVWPQLLEAVSQRPWAGWGLREVSAAHNAVLHKFEQSEPFTYAHNIVLDLAVGIGLPLTLLLVVLAFGWGVSRVRSVKSLAPWFCIAYIAPLAVHSQFEFPFAYAYFLVPVFLAVGAIESMEFPSQAISLPRKIVVSVFSLAGIVALWVAYEYILLEEDFRIARFEARNLGQTELGYERPQTFVLTQLSALTQVSRIKPQPNMSAETLVLEKDVALRFPWNATQNRYALSLALNGNPTEAVRQLKVMRAMHGEENYQAIKATWIEMSNTTYPQLREVALP